MQAFDLVISREAIFDPWRRCPFRFRAPHVPDAMPILRQGAKKREISRREARKRDH